MRFALLALVGVALAVHHSLDLLPLKPRKEYIFRYEGDVHTGLPLPTDTTISRIHAMIHVQVPDDHHAILKLRDVRLATGEDNNRENYKSIEDLKERTLSKKHIELLEMPVRFVYRNGMVSDLLFNEKEEPWSANIKRSVINMLQLNLHKMGRTDEDKLDRYELVHDNDYFTATERIIEGDCEVAYTILKKRDTVTEVTKSVNFDKCTHRPEVMYNFRHLTECKECKEKDFVEPSTVYNYWLEEDGLKKVEVRSIYTVTLENQPMVKTEVRTRLILEETKEIHNEFEWNEGRKETLLYSSEHEKNIERFYKYGDEVEIMPFEEVSNKIEAIRNIMDEIKEHKENNHEVTHLMARLVEVLRMLTKGELKTVHTEIYMRVDERLKNIMEHSLATAGTKNTITHILHLMQKMHLKPYKIVQLLKSIQETPYPSPKIVDELLRFTETEVVKRSPVIHQTIWLTIGSVMRGVVGHTMDEVLVKEKTRELKQRYVRIIMREFEKADTIYEKVLFLKSLGNAGIDISVYDLEKIILDKREELPVRLEAIDAMRLLKEMMPRKIQSILMPIYQSRVEEPELRMAALVRIMHTLPRQSIMVQIVSTMEREPNQQVAAFTYDLLHHFAKSNHVCYKKLANEILPLLTMTRYKRPERVFISTYKYFPLFKEDVATGVNMDFATIFGKNSVWPKEMMVSLDSVLSGMWNKYMIQLGFTQQNIEVIVNKLTQKLDNMEKTTHTMVRGRRIRESLTLLKDIARKLNIHPRITDNRTPHAMVYIRYKEMDYAVLPIDEKILDYLLEKFIRDGRLEEREIEQLLGRDPEFRFHTSAFIYEIIRKIPTILGVPLGVRCKIPTVMSAEGRFKMDLTNDGIQLRLNTMPSLASTMLCEMRLWTPLFEQGVKIVRSIESRLPIDIDMELKYKNGFEVKYMMNIPTEKKTLVQFNQRPMTFFRLLSGNKRLTTEYELKTIVLPQWKRLHYEKELVYNIWGMKTILRGNWLHNWNLRDILIGEYDWEFVMVPTRETPKKIRMMLESGSIEKVRLDKVDFTNLFEKELTVEDTEYENIEERERHGHFNRMIRDMERKEGYRHRMVVKLEAVDSDMERNGHFELVTVCDRDFRFWKFVVEGRRSPTGNDRREWRFFSNMQFILPNMPASLKEFKEQIHREIQGLIDMKWGAEERYNLRMKIQMEQSKEQKKWLRLVDKKRQALTEYDLLYRAARLNQVKVVVDYQLNPWMKSPFEHLYDYIKGYTFLNNKITMLNRENNKVFFKMNVDPVSRTFVDVIIETPRERMDLNNYVLPMQLYLPSIAKRSLYHMRDEFQMPVCEVKSSKVRTFDDVVFRAPLTKCYSVIAKDCSEEPRFVVMVKKVERDSDMKKLKIINENERVIKVEMVDEKLKVFVDDKKVEKEEMERYNIEMIEENMVRVKLEDVVVRFDGYDVKVYMGKHMTDKQCGLCGHFDEERDNEFYTPEKERTDDLMEFHKSYLFKDDECEMEEDLLKEKKHYKIEKYEMRDEEENDFYNDEFYPKDTDRSNRDDDEEEMHKKTHVMEFPNRVCFSLEPLRTCRKNEDMDEMMDKKVRFTCFPRSSHEARELLHKVRNEILDLRNHPVSFVQTIQVPRTCKVY